MTPVPPHSVQSPGRRRCQYRGPDATGDRAARHAAGGARARGRPDVGRGAQGRRGDRVAVRLRRRVAGCLPPVRPRIRCPVLASRHPGVAPAPGRRPGRHHRPPGAAEPAGSAGVAGGGRTDVPGAERVGTGPDRVGALPADPRGLGRPCGAVGQHAGLPVHRPAHAPGSDPAGRTRGGAAAGRRAARVAGEADAPAPKRTGERSPLPTRTRLGPGEGPGGRRRRALALDADRRRPAAAQRGGGRRRGVHPSWPHGQGDD